LITVASVTVLWYGVAPLLNRDVSTYSYKMSIITIDDYTFYDEVDGSVNLQVGHSGDDVPNYVQIILTLSDSNEAVSVHDSPSRNGRARYRLNVSEYIVAGNSPIKVSVAPIFVGKSGEYDSGFRLADLDLSKRSEQGDFYSGLGIALNATLDHTTDGGLGAYATNG